MNDPTRMARLLLCLSLFVSPLAGAVTPLEDDTLALIRRDFSDVDLRRIVAVSNQMALDAPTAQRFWPLYRRYLQEVVALRDQQLQNLGDYARQLNAGRLSDEQARISLQTSLELEQARLQARQRMIRQAGTVLGAQQVLRLYQLEMTMESQMKGRLLEQIPPAE